MGFLGNHLTAPVAIAASSIPFVIVTLRPYFRSIPVSLGEAARLDGCGSVKAFLMVMLPAVKTGIITITIDVNKDLYDKVLKQADTLKNMDMFLRPLFNRNPEKIYNLNKAFSYEKSVNAGMEKDTEEEVDFDEEAFRREKEEKLQKKLLVYEKSLQYLLEKASVTGEVSLGQLKDRLDIYPEEKEIFIPNVDVFKEIMVELIRNRTIDIATLKKERREYIQEQPDRFQLNEMILKLVE